MSSPYQDPNRRDHPQRSSQAYLESTIEKHGVLTDWEQRLIKLAFVAGDINVSRRALLAVHGYDAPPVASHTSVRPQLKL
jgi:hypothetical protein